MMLCKKIFTSVILIIAIGFGLVASFMPPEHMEKTIVMVSRFFEVMLPILAAGALIKYLCACPYSKDCEKSCTNEDHKH